MSRAFARYVRTCFIDGLYRVSENSVKILREAEGQGSIELVSHS